MLVGNFNINIDGLVGHSSVSVLFSTVSVRRYIGIGLCVSLLSACNATPPAPPKLVSQATLAPGTKGAAIPTNTVTPSDTPETPTATNTNTPAPTIPTATPTATITVTRFPTFTPTSPYTPIPKYSPTPTRRPTRIRPTAVTYTPTPQPCTVNWYFNPRPLPCPLGPAVTGPAAFQGFELGFMIWYGPEKIIYTVYTSSGRRAWNQFPDQWNATMPENDPSLVPPEGKLQPVRGFGLLWRNTQGVRERLGWAVGNEVGYVANVQLDSNGNRYIQLPTGGVYMLKGDKSDWVVYK
jgi:hypothetical protein